MPIPLAALIPIISAFAPMAASALGSALGGAKGKKIAVEVADAATSVIDSVFGTRDPDEIAVLARTDASKAAEFRMQMASLATQAEVQTLQAQLADVASARQMANQTPLIAKTQVGLAYLNTALFGGLLIATVSGMTTLTEYGDKTVINSVLGVLGTVWIMQMTFFYGNSTSGHSANNRMADLVGKATSASTLALPPEDGYVPPRKVIAGPAVPLPPDAPVAPELDRRHMAGRGRQPMPDAPGAADALNEMELRP